MPAQHGVQRALAYSAIFLIWGGSFLAIREVVRCAPPFLAAAVRFVIAGALLYGASRLRGAPGPTLLEWRNSALLGAIIFGGNYACLFWSEQHLASSIAAVLTAATPVWMFLGEWLLLRTERLTASTLAGILLGIAGVVLLSRVMSGAAPGQTSGALVLVLGTLFFSAGTLWSKRLHLPSRQTTRAGLQMLIGGLLLFAIAAAAGEYGNLKPVLTLWRWQTTVALLYLIFAASLIAFTSYTWLIHHEPATRVASYAYVNPLVALLLGVALAHEQISRGQWLGIALVLSGVVVTLTGKAAHRLPMAKVAAS